MPTRAVRRCWSWWWTGPGGTRRSGWRRPPAEGAGGPRARRAPLPAAVPPRVAAGRAVLGVGPGGRGERDLRPTGRPPAGGSPEVPVVGRGPDDRQGGHRLPLGREPRI